MSDQIAQPPFATSGLSEAWINIRRQIVVRDGLCIRASTAGAAIVVKSQHHTEEKWIPLMLPNGGIYFVTGLERDTVLALLLGHPL